MGKVQIPKQVGTQETDLNKTLIPAAGSSVEWSIAPYHRDAWSGKTGLISGGVISINGGDAAKIDISAGTGCILDWKTDPENPVITLVSWTAFTAVTLTNLATAIASTIFIDDVGAVVQTSTSVTTPEMQTTINLGVAAHPDNASIASVANNSTMSFGSGVMSEEFIRLFGLLNVSGNVYSANGANLLLDKSTGVTWGVSSNKSTDINDPNKLASGVQSGISSYLQSYRDGGSGFTLAPISAIDPSLWDDGSGTPATVSANKWTIKVIRFAATIGLTTVELGQKEYNSQPEAEAGVMEATSTNQGISEIARRLWLITKNTTTDLQDSAVTLINVPNLDVGGTATGGTAGSGDVLGPAVSVDDNLASFDLTTGKLIQDSGIASTDVSGHLASTANPHSTSLVNIGSGTLAQLNTAVSDATLDDSSASRTPSAHTVASHSDTTATGVQLDTLVGGGDADSLHGHDGKLDVVTTVRTVSGTTDTIVAADNGQAVRYTNASTITLTVPSGLGAGFSVQLIQKGAGVITPTASGTTINNRQGHTTTAGLHAAASLFADVANDFIFQGDTV